MESSCLNDSLSSLKGVDFQLKCRRDAEMDIVT